MPSLPAQTDILIVGAGPTGLALAAELRRLGQQPMIVDRQSAGANTSRACVVHARTLEVLESLGAARELLARGLKVPVFRVRDRDRPLMTIDFTQLEIAYPFTLMISQAEVETRLLGRLDSLGGVVQRGFEFVDFEQASGRVKVRIKSADTLAEVSAKWLIGCDGMHSSVRAHSGIPFEGEAYEQSFVLADIRMDWPLSREEVTLFYSPRGLMVVAPLPDDHYRVVATTDAAPPVPRTSYSPS